MGKFSRDINERQVQTASKRSRGHAGGRIFWMMSVVALASLSVLGCHADANDAAGQAGELADPVRRDYALGNLQRIHSKLLVENKSDRAAPGMKAFQDAAVDKLVSLYVDHPEDTLNGERVIALLEEMREPRGLPALLKALEWKTEVTEQHAILAARALSTIKVPAAERSKVTAKLAEALDRVSGNRGADRRMRMGFITALGKIGDPAGLPALTAAALRRSEEQPFPINEMAVKEIGRIADPSSVPALIEAIYVADPMNPRGRLNQVAPAALVRIGKPAFDPLLATLRGENERANVLAGELVDAHRKRNPNLFPTQEERDQAVRDEVVREAAHALGKLGMDEAFEPLMKLATDKDKDLGIRLGASVGLVSLPLLGSGQAEQVAELLQSLYPEQPKMQRPQLLSAMKNLHSGSVQTFLLDVAKTDELQFPVIRKFAMESFAMLANKAEANQAQAAIDSEAREEIKGVFKKTSDDVLAAAADCDSDLKCWSGKLKGTSEPVAKKATYMLARYGQGDNTAIDALVDNLDHPRRDVRMNVLNALNRVAHKGSSAAVEKIDQIRAKEEGRGSWEGIASEALATQARLVARGK